MRLSDLAERWHAFLEEVVGDVTVLRPDRDWMPTLHLAGRRPVSVVVTSAATVDDLWEAADRIRRELPIDVHRNDILIVGRTWHVPGCVADWSPGSLDAPVAGLLDQYDLLIDEPPESSPSRDSWCAAPWVSCPSGVGVMHTHQSFDVRPHGDHVYDDGADDIDFMQMEASWHLALPHRKRSQHS